MTREYALRALAKNLSVLLSMDDYEGEWYFSVGKEEHIFKVTNISPNLIKYLMKFLCVPQLIHIIITKNIGINSDYIMKGHKYKTVREYSADDVCLTFVYLNTEDKNIKRENKYRRCEYSFGVCPNDIMDVNSEIQFSELL